MKVPDTIAKTILLVEDEAIIALMGKRWLKDEGYNIIHASSGEKAVEAVNNNSSQIDLILMDINLGAGIDGTQAAQIILKDYEIPIIFLSSHTGKEVVQKTEQITSYGYVVKDSNETVLLASIKMAFKLHDANQKVKAHEKALMEREFWLNESQKVARIGSYLYSFKTGTCSGSLTLNQIFGIEDNNSYKIEDWNNLIHPDDREIVLAHLNFVLKNQTLYNIEYRAIRASDYEVIWVHAIGKIIADKEGIPVSMYGTIQDITARKWADEIMQKSEEENRAILNSVPDLFFRISKSGVFLDYRAPEDSQLYISPDQFLGKTISEVFPPHISEPLMEVMEKAYLAREMVTHESGLIIDGNMKFYESRMMRLSNDDIISIVRDITERKESERLFHIQRDLYLLLNSATVLSDALKIVLESVCKIDKIDCGGIYLMDSAKGTLSLEAHLGISEQFAGSVSQYGFESLQLQTIQAGRPVYSRLSDLLSNVGVPEDKLAETLEELKCAAIIPIMHSEKPVASLILASHTHYELPVNTRLALESIAAQIGSAIFRLRQEEEILKVNHQLKELNTTKDKLFSIISHDLKGPFNGFAGLTEDLEKNLDKLNREDISQYASTMNTTAKKMLEFLTNLLEWSRVQSGKMEFHAVKLDLFCEVEDVKSLFSSAAKNKSITFNNEVVPCTNVYADKKLISTLLRNLVSNAIKFSNPGGSVTISSNRAEDFTEISVIDNGIGMALEQLGKVFRIDSVFTTRGTLGEEGSGFGLILCKELIEKNGGKIEVRSTRNQGTEFIFTLPQPKTDLNLQVI